MNLFSVEIIIFNFNFSQKIYVYFVFPFLSRISDCSLVSEPVSKETRHGGEKAAHNWDETVDKAGVRQGEPQCPADSNTVQWSSWKAGPT